MTLRGPLDSEPDEPGWWLASDGKWYPPQSPPAATDTPNQPRSDDQRQALLRSVIDARSARGARIESRSEFQAVVVTGTKINHTLQLILTLVTCGLWGFVWLVLVLTGGEKREVIMVDSFGNVQVRAAKVRQLG
jgi:hypothetical protein